MKKSLFQTLVLAALLAAAIPMATAEPIHDAAMRGDNDAILRLLKNGAKIDARLKPGENTPLALAVAFGHPQTAEILFKKGADPAVFKEDGQVIPALVWMASAGLTERVQKALADGADESVFQKRGTPTLVWTAAAGLTDRVKQELKAHPSDVNSANKGGLTPLMLATRSDKREIVELLLEHGADVNARDSLGRTPLRFAAFSGHVEIAERLIAQGADVNTTDNNETTALMAAANLAYPEMVKLLLEHGADVVRKSQSLKGATALDCARGAKCEEAVALLTQAEAKVSGRLDYCLGKDAFDDAALTERLIAAKNNQLPDFLSTATVDQRKDMLTMAEKQIMKAKVRMGELNEQGRAAITKGKDGTDFRRRALQVSAYIDVLKEIKTILEGS